MDSSERRILVVSCFGHAMTHYNMAVFPALVLPLSKNLGLEMPQVVELSFWHYLLFGITALPWGLAGDAIGGRPLLMLMFLGSGASALAAGAWIGSPTHLVVALALLGFFSGIYHPIGMGMISKGVRRLNMAMGYNAMFGGLGLVLAPVVSGVANWVAGTAAPFYLLAALNLAGGLLLLLCSTESSIEGGTQEKKAANGQLSAFFVLLFPMMLAGVAYTGSTVVLPAYLELKSQSVIGAVSALWSGGISGNLVATTIASIVYIVGMIGQFTGGVVGERYEPRWAYLFFHTMCLPLAVMMAFARDLPLAGLATMYFFFLLGNQAIENTLVARYTPRRLHHSAFGLKFILTFGVGSLAVKLLGWVSRTWGVEASFIALALVSSGIVAGALLLITCTNSGQAIQARVKPSLHGMPKA